MSWIVEIMEEKIVSRMSPFSARQYHPLLNRDCVISVTA